MIPRSKSSASIKAISTFKESNEITEPDLVKLDLSKKSIKEFPINNHLVKSLNASSNRLSELTEQMVTALLSYHRLKSLDLSHNFLESFPEKLRNLSQLEELKLFNNRLQNDSSIKIITSLPNLKILDLSQNKLTSLPESFPPKLEVLSFDFNFVKKLEKISVPSLIRLTLSLTQLESISPDLSFPNLKYLDLSRNSLATLPDLVKFTPKLEVLNLSNNFFPELPTPPLTIREYIIKSNYIIELPENLCTYIHLRSLDVSHNFIEKIPALPPSIISFVFSSNRVKKTTPCKTPNLQRLYLRYNQLTAYPQYDKLQIKEYTAGYNQITTIRHVFFSDLITRVDFTDNQLTEIPSFIFKLPNLTILVVSKNKIRKIPNDIIKLKQIENINLTENPIETLPQLPVSLVNFYIGYCDLKTLPDMKKNVKLNIFDAAGNNLDTYPNAPNLKTLILSRNRFITFPSLEFVSKYFSNIETLDMSFNFIREIPSNLVMNHLEELDLSFNSIKSFPDDFNFPKLKFLKLGSNPISLTSTKKKTISIDVNKGIPPRSNSSNEIHLLVSSNAKKEKESKMDSISISSLSDQLLPGSKLLSLDLPNGFDALDSPTAQDEHHSPFSLNTETANQSNEAVASLNDNSEHNIDSSSANNANDNSENKVDSSSVNNANDYSEHKIDSSSVNNTNDNNEHKVDSSSVNNTNNNSENKVDSSSVNNTNNNSEHKIDSSSVNNANDYNEHKIDSSSVNNTDEPASPSSAIPHSQSSTPTHPSILKNTSTRTRHTSVKISRTISNLPSQPLQLFPQQTSSSSSLNYEKFNNLQICDITNTGIVFDKEPSIRQFFVSRRLPQYQTRHVKVLTSLSWVAFSEMKGVRKTMEDSISLNAFINGDVDMYVICDGHSGHQTSAFSCLFLVDYFSNPCNLQKLARSTAYKAIQKLNSGLYNRQFPDGSTLAMTLFNGRKLVTAHVGDSRIIVTTKLGTISFETIDHKSTDRIVFERVHQAGGRITANRIDGILAPGRSLGDYIVVGNSDEPEVKTYEINPEKDKWLIIACDGLFDVLSNQRIAQLAKNSRSASELAFDLRNLAYSNMSCDNISVIVIDIQKRYQIEQQILDNQPNLDPKTKTNDVDSKNEGNIKEDSLKKIIHINDDEIKDSIPEPQMKSAFEKVDSNEKTAFQHPTEAKIDSEQKFKAISFSREVNDPSSTPFSSPIKRSEQLTSILKNSTNSTDSSNEHNKFKYTQMIFDGLNEEDDIKFGNNLEGQYDRPKGFYNITSSMSMPTLSPTSSKDTS